MVDSANRTIYLKRGSASFRISSVLVLLFATITACTQNGPPETRPVDAVRTEATNVYASPSGDTSPMAKQSHPFGAANAPGEGRAPSVSRGGRFVAFVSSNPGLVPGAMKSCPACELVFVRDMRSGSTELVSVSSDDIPANASASAPDITPDGRFVVFASPATNLVSVGGSECPWYEGPYPCTHIFVRDRTARTTSLVSVSSAGVLANGENYDPHLSDDGRRVVFTSDAGNLSAGDTYSCGGYDGNLDHWGAAGGCPDVYLHDLQTRTTTRVSVSSAGAQPNAPASEPDISGDGTTVVFSSAADKLVADDEGYQGDGDDIFVRDLEAKSTTSPTIAWRNANAPPPPLDRYAPGLCHCHEPSVSDPAPA